MMTGTSPKPTRAPGMRFDFRKRQALADSDTCGWEDIGTCSRPCNIYIYIGF
jgi:hypothetical protein